MSELVRFVCPFCHVDSGGYEPLLDIWHCTACDAWKKGKPEPMLAAERRREAEAAPKQPAAAPTRLARGEPIRVVIP